MTLLLWRIYSCYRAAHYIYSQSGVDVPIIVYHRESKPTHSAISENHQLPFFFCANLSPAHLKSKWTKWTLATSTPSTNFELKIINI